MRFGIDSFFGRRRRTPRPAQEISLRVGERTEGDLGLRRVRLDAATRVDLDVSVGDYVEIWGEKPTIGMVWRLHREEEGRGTVRIDEFMRSDSGAKIGSKVWVKRVHPLPAEDVHLRLLGVEERLTFDTKTAEKLRRHIMHMGVHEGATVPCLTFVAGSRPLVYEAVKVVPDTMAAITRHTNIHIS